MSKEAVKREHQDALRELIVFGMAGIKLTKELRRREALARTHCEQQGACRCAEHIKEKK
jgi:hypothetical protein